VCGVNEADGDGEADGEGVPGIDGDGDGEPDIEGEGDGDGDGQVPTTDVLITYSPLLCQSPLEVVHWRVQNCMADTPGVVTEVRKASLVAGWMAQKARRYVCCGSRDTGLANVAVTDVSVVVVGSRAVTSMKAIRLLPAVASRT
jgi:hypothetical protein